MDCILAFARVLAIVSCLRACRAASQSIVTACYSSSVWFTNFPPHNAAAMDGYCVRIIRRASSVRISIDVSRRGLVTVKDISNVCDVLAQVVGKLRAEDAGMNVWLERFDPDNIIRFHHSEGDTDGACYVVLMMMNGDQLSYKLPLSVFEIKKSFHNYLPTRITNSYMTQIY